MSFALLTSAATLPAHSAGVPVIDPAAIAQAVSQVKNQIQQIKQLDSQIRAITDNGNYADLLVGVNIGGAGTLIASLASLITFAEYTRHNPGKAGSYILKFSLFNFGFLAVLIAVMMIF